MKEADRLASSSMTGNELLSTGSNAQCALAGKHTSLTLYNNFEQA